MINKVAEKCTGCGACYSACPVKAIDMIESDEGFLYPQIDENKCIKCGLCTKTCSVLNPTYKNNSRPECFAAMASDEIRYKSASGGVFPVLAYEFLNRGGYVAGAVWDENWGVKHIISNQKEDIEKMRSSKYLQSVIGNCLEETKRILDSGTEVLFTGTPCQIAGLKSYLRKEYDNLYTVEIICHGTPSPKVFRKYLEEEFDKNNIQTIDFRSKKNGWGCGELEIKYNNKLINLKVSEYYNAFLKNLILRKSCTSCTFNKLPRQADLTTADFWGINKFNRKYNDNKGTSVVLINNSKGNTLLEILNKKAKLLKKVPIKNAIRFNANIVRTSYLHPARDVFFDNIEKFSIKENIGRILDDNCDCMVLNLWYACNYGASLTCLGVKSLLEKIGMITKVINYVPELKLKYKGSFAEDFAKKYLNLTKPIESYEDLLALNLKCKNFIAGSDQIFASFIINSMDFFTRSLFLLDFVSIKNKKISYAASFGNENLSLNYKNKYIFNHFVKQFDHLSIREEEGIDILKKDFDIHTATQLIDGAFHIPHNLLEEMTNKYKKKEKYIGCYVLPYYSKNKWYRKHLKEISSKLNLPIKEMKFNLKTPLEEWLAFIKNSEFIVSDSYHAIVFSIIFNKPFIQIKNATSQSRFESLFRLLDIKNNSIDKFSVLDDETIFIKRDWDLINKRISKEVSKAESWMRIALNSDKNNIKELEIQNFYLIQSQLDKKEYNRNLQYIREEKKILCKYYFYKTIKNFCFGKHRKQIKEKIRKYKEIKNIINKT